MEIAGFFQPVDLKQIALGKRIYQNVSWVQNSFQPESLMHIDLAIFSVHDDRGFN